MNLFKIRKIFSDPVVIISALASRGWVDWLPDKQYLKLFYFSRLKKRLDLDTPKSFNEKLQWLKLYDRKPEYTQMVDKYEVKKYVADIIGEEYIIQTINVWDSFDDIDFDGLPNKFVLKCTHDSGGIIVCKDKSTFDKNSAKKKIEKSLKKNYYWHGREWPYKYVKPRIIAEQFLSEIDNEDVMDYKVFVFSGRAEFVQVDYDRFVNHHRNFYNRDWEYQPFTTMYPTNPEHQIEKPEKLNELLELAEAISKSLQSPAQVRVDFYIVANRIYFGEVTFYHGSGFEKFYPEEWDYKLGEWITLPEKKNEC